MPGKVEIDVVLQGAAAEAEAAKIDKSLDNIGKSGQSGANQAKAGLNNLEKAARDTKTQIANFDKEILDSRAQLAQMSQRLVDVNQQFGRSSTEAAALRQQMSQVGAATRGLVAEKALLVAESKAEEAAVNASTSAFSKKTTMINTGQGALKGYDAALTGVIRSVGGINLGWAVAISLGASLIPVISELTRAKEVHIKVDEDQIKADLDLADVSSRQIRTTGDLVASFRILANERKMYERNTRELTNAESLLEGQGFQTGKMVDASGHVYEIVARNAGDLQKQIGEVNTRLGDQDKTLQPVIAAIRRYADAHGITTDQVIETSGAVRHFAAEDLPFIRAQLAATVPFVQQLSDALTHLSIPRFDLSGTGAGLEQQQSAVLKGLTALDEKGFTGKDVTRALSPSLKGIADDLKKGASSVADFNSKIQQLNPAVREQVQAMLALDKASKDAFATHRSGAGAIRATANELANLRKRAEESEAALLPDSTAKRIARIEADIKAEREHLDINKRDTIQALAFLERIKKAMVQAVLNDEAEQNRVARERNLKEQRDFRVKENAELRQHLSHQRQIREDMEREALVAEAKIADERRRDRPGRAQTSADEIARQTAALNEVQAAFGGASQSAQMYQLQLDLAAGKSVSTGQVVKAMFAEVFLTVQAAMAWFSALGNAFGNLFEGLVEGGRSAKALFYDFIASILQAMGQMAIAVGTVFLFLPGHTGLGIGLIAAGVAAMALAGVFRGLASNAQKSADAKNQAASAGGSAAAAGGGSQSAPRSPTVIPFPTSGSGSRNGTTVVNVSLDRQGTSDFLDGRQVVTLPKARGSQNRALRKALAS